MTFSKGNQVRAVDKKATVSIGIYEAEMKAYLQLEGLVVREETQPTKERHITGYRLQPDEITTVLVEYPDGEMWWWDNRDISLVDLSANIPGIGEVKLKPRGEISLGPRKS